MAQGEITDGLPAGSPPSVFVICPANAVTGGPELLHQLVSKLQRSGRAASIVYFPFGSHHETPQPYQHYGVRIGQIVDVTPDSIVVVPEVSTWLLPRLPRSKIHFWWLSVDNFRTRPLSRRYAIFPKPLAEWAAMTIVRKMADAQLCQSEYARTFVTSHGLTPALPLSDYLGSPYNEAAAAPRQTDREDLIVYNPAKGLDRTRRILDELAQSSPIPIEAAAIQKMSRMDVVALFRRAKLYIDFGNHPGKDRLPREAASLGCCVLTNRRGSAGNAVDVPIDDQYKIDDLQPGFEQVVAGRIIDICSNFAAHAPQFDRYRAIIADEPKVFAEQVAVVFQNMPAMDRHSAIGG